MLISCLWLDAGAQFSLRLPPAPSLGSGRDTVSMVIIGDVMMHARQLEYDFHPFLEQISPALREADFAVANLEFSLGGTPYTGYPAFSAPDDYARYLAEDCGIDVFLTANNHILDRRSAGLERTLDIYGGLRDSLGVLFTGSARDSSELAELNPLILFSHGIKIALVNFTYGTNLGRDKAWPKVEYMNEESVGRAISRAKEQRVDFIIALPHWGTEYSLRHDSTQERWAKWLVEQGVDAVIGAHPHVVQDSTHIDGKCIIYSIGNAVSNMSARNTRLGLLVELSFVADHVTGEKVLLEPQLHFIWCTLPGMLVDNYSTIMVKEWADRRSEWLTPSDHDNMVQTLERVMATCY